MRPALVLAWAGVAAVLLTAVIAVVSVARDPEVRDCADALADARTANGSHQAALSNLADLATPRGGRERGTEAEVDEARRRAAQTELAFDAAVAEVTRLCHYDSPSQPPTATTPTPRESL